MILKQLTYFPYQWLFVFNYHSFLEIFYSLQSITIYSFNIGKTLSDIHHSRILYDPPPRVLEIKAKINKWDLIKIKSFYTTKETISKVKRQPLEAYILTTPVL